MQETLQYSEPSTPEPRIIDSWTLLRRVGDLLEMFQIFTEHQATTMSEIYFHWQVIHAFPSWMHCTVKTQGKKGWISLPWVFYQVLSLLYCIYMTMLYYSFTSVLLPRIYLFNYPVVCCRLRILFYFLFPACDGQWQHWYHLLATTLFIQITWRLLKNMVQS